MPIGNLSAVERAAIEAGAFARLAPLAAELITVEQARAVLINYYGRLGNFGELEANAVIGTYLAGVEAARVQSLLDGQALILPTEFALLPGATERYAYDITFEFYNRETGERKRTVKRFTSETALTADQLLQRATAVAENAAMGQDTLPGFSGGGRQWELTRGPTLAAVWERP